MTLRACILAALLSASTLGPSAAAAESAADLSARAMAAYTAKDYARSADLFVQAIAAGEAEAGAYYNAACSAALAGRNAQALDLLEGALAMGWTNAAHLRKDTDLAGLHADPRWPALLASADRIAEREQRVWGSKALATSYRETLGEEERVAGLSRAWSEVKYNFANFDLVPALDWDQAYLDFLPRVRAATRTVDYYRELSAFMALLQDGHSNAQMPRELFDTAYARPGLGTMLVEGRVLVRDVFDPQLQAAGVRPGWEVVAVGGTPVREYAERNVRRETAASTPQDRESRMYERYLLMGDAKASVRVAFADASGATRTLDVRRLADAERAKLLPNTAPFEWKLLPGNVAWVALRSFGNDQAAQEFERHFAEIAKADAIVFDVRDNGGGNSDVGYRILSTLGDKPLTTTTWRTRDYRPTFRAWGQGEKTWRGTPGQVPPHATLRYTKPVAVLTSARTYSAAEDFVVAFDVMERGRIVGEATGGSTGQPLMFALPGGGSARVCTKRDSYPDGREFVGVGVKPDVAVSPTVADVRASRDTVLEAALALLREQG